MRSGAIVTGTLEKGNNIFGQGFLSGTFGGVDTTSTFTPAGAVKISGALVESTFTLSGGSFESGDLLRMEVFRDISADNLGEGAILLYATLEFNG